MKHKIPKCFKSSPNYQEQAENVCLVCRYSDECFNLSQWEEEFKDEDELDDEYGDLRLYTWCKLGEIAKKYLEIDYDKRCNVKVQCRKGEIRIIKL